MKRLFLLLTTLIAVAALGSCTIDETGDTGNTGNTGDTGDSGDTGNTGDTADSGDDSDAGNTGDTGNTGNTGDTGENWEDHACYERTGDADADGIPNSVECPEFPCVDNDGDELPDCLDTDSDGDTISDSVECGTELPCADTDEDTNPDYLDRDSDNDGLPDKKEKDGGTDPLLKDSDGDGSDDLAEIAYGSDPLDDNDSIPAGIFYVVLPYNAPDEVTRTLTFSTKIEAIDVIIIFDRSASMNEEADNLKAEVKTEIIDGIAAQFPSPGFAAYGLASFGYETMYKMHQTMTTDTGEIKTAVDGLDTPDGNEMTTEAIYQTTTGEGITGHYHTKVPGFGDMMQQDVNVPKQDCNGKLGTVGGACFRKKTMPIYIFITDEVFTTAPLAANAGSWDTTIWDWANPEPHSVDQAIASMNGIGAKVIGIDSGFSDEGQSTDDAKDDFELYSQMTGSVNTAGESFIYHTENANGSGIGGQIADAVISLTTWIDMDVTTGKMSDEDCYGQTAADFVISSKTIEADPLDGVSGQDETTFFSVTQGTDVTFDVRFYNDFCINQTDSWLEFEAHVTVLGNNSYLSSRLVHVVVPESENK